MTGTTIPPTGGGLELEERVTPAPSYEDGDHERFAHYVLKDKIMESALSGSPVIALCGKVWVPGRDPKRFPVCPMCAELYELGPEGRARFWAERSGGGDAAGGDGGSAG